MPEGGVSGSPLMVCRGRINPLGLYVFELNLLGGELEMWTVLREYLRKRCNLFLLLLQSLRWILRASRWCNWMYLSDSLYNFVGIKTVYRSVSFCIAWRWSWRTSGCVQTVVSGVDRSGDPQHVATKAISWRCWSSCSDYPSPNFTPSVDFFPALVRTASIKPIKVL